MKAKPDDQSLKKQYTQKIFFTYYMIIISNIIFQKYKNLFARCIICRQVLKAKYIIFTKIILDMRHEAIETDNVDFNK